MSDARRRGASHSGSLVAGIWLIAIGLAFVVRDASHLSWSEGWPLFVIAAGCASLVTSLLGRRRLSAGAWSLLWPLGWIAVGGALLASTTGRVDAGPLELLSRWWPVVLMGIGVWFLIASVWPGRARPVETLVIPLAGAPAADVRVSFGAGELLIGRSEPGTLTSGTYEGGVVYRSPGPGFVEIKPDTGSTGWPISAQAYRWAVGLTAEVPLDLRLETGASRASIDLGDVLLRRLDLRSGASETRVRLPRAAGLSQVHVETGVASLTMDVPAGVAARVRSRMALGRTSVDEQRFPRTEVGWESSDFLSAPNRVEIDVQGGVGSVTIR